MHTGCISGIFKFFLWRIWFFIPNMSWTGIFGLYPVQWDETTDHVTAIQMTSKCSLSVSVFLSFVFSIFSFLFSCPIYFSISVIISSKTRNKQFLDWAGPWTTLSWTIRFYFITKAMWNHWSLFFLVSSF